MQLTTKNLTNATKMESCNHPLSFLILFSSFTYFQSVQLPFKIQANTTNTTLLCDAYTCVTEKYGAYDFNALKNPPC